MTHDTESMVVPTLENRLYTVEEVAKIFSVKPYTARGWLRDGVIKGIKVRGTWRVSQAEVTRFANQEYGDKSEH